MLPKFKVLGDGSANPFFSSSLIVRNLNIGARNVGLYDENGKVVIYDTTANTHGLKADAILCVYETAFPVPVLQNANGLPLIGCSLHNLFFITDTGYPTTHAAFCNLGVDSRLFKPTGKLNNKFRFLCFAESNARSGIDVVISAFSEAFAGSQDVELYLKDRGATDTFKRFVEKWANEYNVNIIHDTDNTQNFDELLKMYNDANVMVFCSRSTTWGMTLLESMACGVPVITTAYAGPREYVADGFNGWIVPHTITPITQQHLDAFAKVGFRNHMFPPACHHVQPYWAEPYHEGLKEIMLEAKNLPKKSMDCLSKNARITAENYTWEKAAASLSAALFKIYE